MIKVLLGTPAYDGRLSVFYADSMNQTISIGRSQDIEVIPIFLAMDALIQRARNDLFEMAHSNKVDYLFFIDSDIGWNPEDFFRLLKYEEHIVAGSYRKKTDKEELYPIKIKPGEKKFELRSDGLIEVYGAGTGFMRIDKYAIDRIWENSEKYIENGKEKRMAFNVTIVNGEIVSEDISFCNLWLSLGEKIYVDTEVTCSHTGDKTYYGNLKNWLEKNKFI